MCCETNPIFVDGCLFFMCVHTTPRTVKDRHGMFLLKDGKKVYFEDLFPMGNSYTDKYGNIRSFSTSKDKNDRVK